MILPEADYIKVMSSVPIVCVDGLVVNSKKNFCWLKGKMNHLKMNFGCLAADYLKNEKLVSGIKRKMMEELGVEVKGYKKPRVF